MPEGGPSTRSGRHAVPEGGREHVGNNSFQCEDLLFSESSGRVPFLFSVRRPATRTSRGRRSLRRPRRPNPRESWTLTTTLILKLDSVTANWTVGADDHEPMGNNSWEIADPPGPKWTFGTVLGHTDPAPGACASDRRNGQYDSANVGEMSEVTESVSWRASPCPRPRGGWAAHGCSPVGAPRLLQAPLSARLSESRGAATPPQNAKGCRS